MKKTLSVLILILTFALAAFTGCADNQTFTQKHYEYNDGETVSFNINATDREIEIGVSYDNKIYIECYESEKEYYNITNENGIFSVNFVTDKKWTDYVSAKPSANYRKIFVKLPSGAISNVTVTTTNENIAVNKVSVQESITLTSNGGDILLNKVNVGETINLTAKNGDIVGTVVGDWNTFAIACTIKKGDCNLPLNKQDGNKLFTANCNNGDINVTFVEGN